MRDEGHVAPAAAPAVFVPPRTRSYPPALVRTPHARSYPPALIRTPRMLASCCVRTPPAFVSPCPCLHLPTLARVSVALHLHLPPRARIRCPVVASIAPCPCLLFCARVCCPTLAFVAPLAFIASVLPVKQNIVSI